MMLYVMLAVVAGLMIPMQGGANAEIGRRLGHPIHGAVMNFVVGATVLVIAALAVVREVPPIGRAMGGGTPWWAWIGGLLGASFVFIAVVATPKIGALNYMLCMLAGQLVAAILIDRFGLVGFPMRELTTQRVIGVLVVIVGVGLVASAK
ncbi:MAG: DMT family transporter [Phycisphaerales bacterium]|nr:DMT family transporter [Phycisphaerales bacterium]